MRTCVGTENPSKNPGEMRGIEGMEAVPEFNPADFMEPRFANATMAQRSVSNGEIEHGISMIQILSAPDPMLEIELRTFPSGAL